MHKEKICRALDFGGSFAQGQGHDLSYICNDLQTADANFIRPLREVEHNENVCPTRNLDLKTQSQCHSLWPEVKSCLSNS